MNLDLKGRTALVCGGSQGLGAAVARELAWLGSNVIVLARNEIKLQTLVADLDQTKGQQHGYIVADSTEPDALIQKVGSMLKQGLHFDIVVNNSGGPAAGPLLDTDAAALEQAFRSHLIVSHLLAQLLVPGMKGKGLAGSSILSLLP